jgi:hypothetical protein
MDFPQLTMTLPDGREESIMKRTTLVRSVALRRGVHTVPCPGLGLNLPCSLVTHFTYPCRWQTRATCPWRRARRPSTRASRLLSTTETWWV